MSTNPNRRDFLAQTAAAAVAGLGALSGGATGAAETQAAETGAASGVRSRKEPVAIAMWDFSWLLRHYSGGEFEDWNAVLDGLVARGYNAIRLDVFPALVAPQPDGKVVATYDYPKLDWKPAMWGQQYSTTVNPRQALKEFLARCHDRGLLLGLSTWFIGPGAEQVAGLDAFARVWDETLAFLQQEDLLHNIYYVDLLNEYPLFSGFAWLRQQMDAQLRAQAEQAQGGAHEWKANIENYNDEQSRAFYLGFANDALGRLQAKWPGLDFLFSQTNHFAADWRALVPTRVAAIDLHDWFVMNPVLGDKTGYWENIHSLADNDRNFPQVQAALLKNWTENKPALIARMDQHMAEVAAVCRQHDKPVGNTEGWGIINWLDHPALTWEIIQEAGEICAGLGRKHGYRFLCTSNFTHPQFPRLWADVAWHQRVTGIIRQG
jgi:hypothetical protein